MMRVSVLVIALSLATTAIAEDKWRAFIFMGPPLQESSRVALPKCDKVIPQEDAINYAKSVEYDIDPPRARVFSCGGSSIFFVSYIGRKCFLKWECGWLHKSTAFDDGEIHFNAVGIFRTVTW